MGPTGELTMLLLTLALLFSAVQGEDVTVNLSKGKLRGARLDYDFGQYYYAFKGIPYARPPVKELRFKPPVEVGHWPDTLDATEDGSLCPQFDISHNEPIGDEDCLTLNVYTPKMDSKKRAVMVYFHGGAYIMGGGASFFFGPGYLLEQNVVLVTFNYRLGPLGFLSTDDKAAAGNQGLLDQIMVLKWVKANIEKFGGDPNKVTIFGEDSGAASVTLMAMSPMAQGLFHGAIALSGNALCDQYLQNEPQEASRELATKLECSAETEEDIIICLSRKTQQEIIKAAQQMFMFWSFPRWFAPSVDGLVLPATPADLLLQGKFAKDPPCDFRLQFQTVPHNPPGAQEVLHQRGHGERGRVQAEVRRVPDGLDALAVHRPVRSPPGQPLRPDVRVQLRVPRAVLHREPAG